MSDYKVFDNRFDEEIRPESLLESFGQAAELTVWGDGGLRREAEKSSAWRVTGSEDLSAESGDAPVTLLLDLSGSQRGAPVLAAFEAARRFGDAMTERGAEFFLLGHTTVAWKGGEPWKRWTSEGRPPSPGRMNSLRLVTFHAPGEDWARNRELLAAMLIPGLHKENIDGEALEWAAQKSVEGPVIMLMDGPPLDDATSAANHMNPDLLLKHRNEVLSSLTAAGRPVSCVLMDHWAATPAQARTAAQAGLPEDVRFSECGRGPAELFREIVSAANATRTALDLPTP